MDKLNPGAQRLYSLSSMVVPWVVGPGGSLPHEDVLPRVDAQSLPHIPLQVRFSMRPPPFSTVKLVDAVEVNVGPQGPEKLTRPPFRESSVYKKVGLTCFQRGW